MDWNRKTAGGGLLGAALVAGAVIFYNWDATPRFEGEITEVRTLGMDASSSVAIVNFKATNSSNYEVSIMSRQLEAVDAGGARWQGHILSVFDIQQLFQYFPALGGLRDEPLVDDRHIAPGESLRGLAAARFEIPKHELDARRDLVFRTVDSRGRRTALREPAE